MNKITSNEIIYYCAAMVYYLRGKKLDPQIERFLSQKPLSLLKRISNVTCNLKNIAIFQQ